jgi:NAD(P)-dependent dehydrogenase (short-subunit alcohol dehydrogenase family)
VPKPTAIGSAFGAIENLTANLAFEVSPFGVRVVCVRTLANTDSRSIQDTMEFLASQLNITTDQNEVLCLGEIVNSQYAGQRGDHSPRFVPEEMFTEFHYMFTFMTGRTST